MNLETLEMTPEEAAKKRSELAAKSAWLAQVFDLAVAAPDFESRRLLLSFCAISEAGLLKQFSASAAPVFIAFMSWAAAIRTGACASVSAKHDGDGGAFSA